MNAKETLSRIKTALGMEISLEQMALDNGAIIEAEKFEAGSEVFIVNEDERIALPIGEYLLEDGKSLIVAEEGIISDIKEVEEEVVEEAPVEEAPEEVEATTEVATPKKVVESITKEMFFSEIEKLRGEIAELKLAKVEVEAVELSAVEEITHSPEANVEKKKMQKFSKNRGTSTRDVVFAKLFKN